MFTTTDNYYYAVAFGVGNVTRPQQTIEHIRPSQPQYNVGRDSKIALAIAKRELKELQRQHQKHPTRTDLKLKIVELQSRIRKLQQKHR